MLWDLAKDVDASDGAKLFARAKKGAIAKLKEELFFESVVERAAYLLNTRLSRANGVERVVYRLHIVCNLFLCVTAHCHDIVRCHMLLYNFVLF